MKTSKDKAEELVKKFREGMPDIYFEYMDNNAIQCAKIAVDEIIDNIDRHEFEVDYEQLKYWQEVKNELNKMS